MIEPRHSRVLLQLIPHKFKTVVLTDPLIARFAHVRAIGPEVEELAIGDVVAIPGIAAEHPDWKDGDMLLVQEQDLFKVSGLN